MSYIFTLQGESGITCDMPGCHRVRYSTETGDLGLPEGWRIETILKCKAHLCPDCHRRRVHRHDEAKAADASGGAS